MWFPFHLNEGGPYPVAVFAHGMGSGIARDLSASLASLGFVVFAPKDFGTGCPEWQDDLHVIDVAKSNASLHKSIAHIDWSRAALLGHSMGGNQVMAAAARSNASYNLKAVVASHGVNDGAAGNLTMPAMFETSDHDRTVWPSKVKAAFDACPSRPKVFAQARGRGHMEPEQDGVVNPYMAHFVGCEVAGLKTSCDKVYGDGPDSICHDANISSCVVTKSLEVLV